MCIFEERSVFRFPKGLDQRREWSRSCTGPLPNKILAASGMELHCMAITLCKMGNRGGRMVQGGVEETVLQ